MKLSLLSAKVISIVLMSAQMVSAESMNIETHQLMIQKLEVALKSGSSNNQMVQLRLADLYADQARLKTVIQADGKCTTCADAERDRSKALVLYYTVFGSLESQDQQRVLLQIAHLSNQASQKSKLKVFVEGLARDKKSDSQLKGLAYYLMAEDEFRNQKFKNAFDLYQTAISLNSSVNTPITKYRIAWSLFHLDKIGQAEAKLVEILENPGNESESFLGEVSLDLVVFATRSSVNSKKVSDIHNLTPQSFQKKMLLSFSDQLIRHGKFSASVVVLDFLQSHHNLNELESAGLYLDKAKASYEANTKQVSLKNFQTGLKSLANAECSKSPEECRTLQKEFRTFLISWNNDEKLNPSKNVELAYASYTSAFPEDYETFYWAAQTAFQLENYSKAQEYFRKTALITRKKSEKEAVKLFTASLMGEIEVADAAKSISMKEAAYKNYLDLNANGPEAFAMRYGLARMQYERKDFNQAADSFYKLANVSQKSLSKAHLTLAKQSADLALDSLASLKDNKRLLKWSLEFANSVWPAHKKDYLVVFRRAALNQATSILANKEARDRDFEQALEPLKLVPLNGLSNDESTVVLKTQIALHEKLKNIQSVQASAKSLLAIAKKKEDKEFASRKLVWAAEIQLDFSTALKITEQGLVTKDLSPTDRLFKLGFLASLSGKNAKKYYLEYIRKTPSVEMANQVRAQLIRKSKTPWSDLRADLGKLSKTPDLLADLSLELFAKNKNIRVANEVLSYSKVAKTVSGQALNRHLQFGSYLTADKRLSQHFISTGSDRAVQKGIAQRLQHLQSAESLANTAIQKADWALQVMALSTLQREYARLYKDLKALPVPQQLNEAERKLYSEQLERQAQPYLAKSNQIETQLKKYWDNTNHIKVLEAQMSVSSQPTRLLLASEAKILAQYASGSSRSTLNRLSQVDTLDAADLARARGKVKKDPFSKDYLANLRSIEIQIGESQMVAFIDARLKSLDSGGLQ